jgi:hypothetical protein
MSFMQSGVMIQTVGALFAKLAYYLTVPLYSSAGFNFLLCLKEVLENRELSLVQLIPTEDDFEWHAVNYLWQILT